MTNQLLIHPWQKTPQIKIETYFHERPPVWSLVMPVFNQEKRLIGVLEKIIKNAQFGFEIILIDDGSDDNSIAQVHQFMESMRKSPNSKVISITLIHNPVPVFETACDNQGFRMAKAEYVIEIQADLQIEEANFDAKMIGAMNKFSLGAVSGRHVHSFSMLEGRRAWFKYPLQLALWRILRVGKEEGWGRLGNKIFQRLESAEDYCYVGETVARGPWLLRKTDLEKFNYLDEENFYLGNDDHDLHRRMYLKDRKKVGYVPLDVHSISEDGSTRKPRSGINQKVYDFLKNNKNGSQEFRRFMKRYRPYLRLEKYRL
ncbi:glycosyltransferase family 2 protein [Polynucleobacter paneuropaeus]|nr:glycosyltransferase family 2 protein [Polynucleobacter paneuropaeus]MBT8555565.1 glycosyltransferase family 2 protein [Polynucleobacter paneuropaeus]MBT8560841.1 glycosyltransferase family 2 protein [Polynucleobacter paneuropaeus]